VSCAVVLGSEPVVVASVLLSSSSPVALVPLGSGHGFSVFDRPVVS
jgi:hypothetical protein